MKLMRANIDLFSEAGIPVPTRQSAELFMTKVDTLGIDRNELLFSGHGKPPKDMSKVDEQKLLDKSAEETGSKEFLNSREIEVVKFHSDLDDELPDYDEEINELKIIGTEKYTRGDYEAVEKIKARIKILEAKNQQIYEQRQDREEAFEIMMNSHVERPVYFCGDSKSILMENNEDNPLSYAATSNTKDLSSGYLSIYQRLELVRNGAEIRMLNEATSRMDHQVLVYAEHTIMEAGKLALVYCKFEFIG